VTTAVKVVRRFEIRVGSAHSPADVERGVKETVEAQRSAEITCETDVVQRPPLVGVRLEGAAGMVSDVMASIAEIHGQHIQHDVLKVRAEGTKPRRETTTSPNEGGHGSVYPDLHARVRIGAEALPAASASVPVIVAIVDSGLMVEHPDFKDHLWTGKGGIHGKQFIEGKSDYDIGDQDGHGTLLAGTVLAAAADAPVKLLTAKFFDAAQPAQPDNAADALEFAVNAVSAVDEKAKIILLAWDVGLGSAKLESAFREACQHALVVIAAGNYGSDNDWHDGQSSARVPVRYARDFRSSTISVMATDEYNEKAWFSNYGPETVDLAAPGVDIMSTRRALSSAPGDRPRRYRSHGGTSAAAAHVAGAAALLMSRYPSFTAEQIKTCLIDSVNDLSPLKCASKGRLNIVEALRRAAIVAGPRRAAKDAKEP
jgi:subtilisin family serine protease